MKIINRKARYNYNLLETFESGIVLTGSEVKSIKNKQIKLEGSFIRVDSNLEAWLVNCHISPYVLADNRSYDPKRSRKLLLHKKVILSLLKKMESKKLTLVPVSCYTTRGKIKLEIALAKGKKKWEKKERIKKRDLNREVEQELKFF